MSRPAPPAGWLTTDLGSVTTEEKTRVGAGPAPVVLSSTKHHGLVPSDDYFKGRTIYSADLRNYKLVKQNWFAYATNHLAEGSIGLQATFKTSCVSPIYTVFSCRDSVDPGFLFRVVKSPRAVATYQLHEQASVDRRGAVRYKDFAKVQLHLPSLLEQQRIAETLDTIDDAIRSTERLIAKLETMKHGLLHDLLTRGVDDNGDLRSEHAHRFKESSLGRIPHQWQVLSLGDFSTRITNGFVGIATPHYTQSSDGVPYLYGNNVRSNRLDMEDVTRINRSFHLTQRKSQLQPGDMVTVQSGHIGTTAVVPSELTEANCHALIITKFTPGAVNPHFVSAYCNYSLATGRMSPLFIGSTIKHINTSDFAKFAIPFPPQNEQGRINALIQEHDTSVLTYERSLDKLRLLKAGLMEDLLTGRVRVNVGADGTA